MSDLRDQFADWARRSSAAQAAAAQAYARLLSIAETQDGGQAQAIAQFIVGTYDGAAFPFDLFGLRTVDVEVSDDMLACLDALRWAKADLHKLVPDGEARVMGLCAQWGFTMPGGA